MNRAAIILSAVLLSLAAVCPLEPADAHSVGTVQASTHRYVAVLWDNGLGVPFWYRFEELQHQELGK